MTRENKLNQDICDLLKTTQKDLSDLKENLLKDLNEKDAPGLKRLEAFISYALLCFNCDFEKELDLILLNCRKLLELLIILDWINQKNNIDDFNNYSKQDFEEFGISMLKISEGITKNNPSQEKYTNEMRASLEQKFKIQQIPSVKIKKMPPLKNIISDPDLLDEYNSLYKITSKILHTTVFSIYMLDRLKMEELRRIIIIKTVQYVEGTIYLSNILREKFKK